MNLNYKMFLQNVGLTHSCYWPIAALTDVLVCQIQFSKLKVKQDFKIYVGLIFLHHKSYFIGNVDTLDFLNFIG